MRFPKRMERFLHFRTHLGGKPQQGNRNIRGRTGEIPSNHPRNPDFHRHQFPVRLKTPPGKQVIGCN
jgi:hypothetical protein